MCYYRLCECYRVYYCCYTSFWAYIFFFFFFNDTATTEIYTLSLHDALPLHPPTPDAAAHSEERFSWGWLDRKSTRLNSSHLGISYAVFCLKKKKNTCFLPVYTCWRPA